MFTVNKGRDGGQLRDWKTLVWQGYDELVIILQITTKYPIALKPSQNRNPCKINSHILWTVLRELICDVAGEVGIGRKVRA